MNCQRLQSGGSLQTMFGSGALCALVLLAADAGVADAGTSDAGRVDAGRADASVADAGPAMPVEYWQHDGGEEIEEGITDALAVRLGSTLMVSFNEPVTLRVCDLPLVDIRPEGESLLFKGVKEGETECGFWFSRKQPVPQRRMRIKVLGPRGSTAPPKKERAWWAPESKWTPPKDEE